MKSNYEVRAMKFAHTLVKLFDGCIDLGHFEDAIEMYNMTHTRQLKYANGVSRIAIIRSDYVIKFDYRPDHCWEDGRAGNCTSEAEIYARAIRDGYEYLLAKTTVCTINGLTFSIMPKINDVGDWHRDWRNYCTADEKEWLSENLNDLHSGNVGYKNNKVCVIDYAWDNYDKKLFA